MDKDSSFHKEDIESVFKSLNKLNPEATYLSENALSNVDTWYDTGCYALNAIVGGSCREGGVPKGRLVGFSGPSQSGKTYIINKILGNAQKMGLHPIIFDTEFAVDKESSEGVGLDATKTKYVPVYTVEQCRNQVVALLDSIIEKGLQGKFIISIDSLGNLAADKENLGKYFILSDGTVKTVIENVDGELIEDIVYSPSGITIEG